MLKKILSHSFFLSVAWTETGAVRGFQVRTVPFFLVIFFLLSLLSVAIYRTILNVEMTRSMVVHTTEAQKRTLKDEISRLEEERSYQTRQFSVFADELGILQARLERFDAISEKLFADEEIGQYLAPELEGEDLHNHEEGEGHTHSEIDGKGGPISDLFEAGSTIDYTVMEATMKELHEKADIIEQALQAGLNLVSLNYNRRLQQPHMWPVVHTRTRLTSAYGWRKDPFRGTRSWHAGVDIGGGYNAPIVATADGIVVFSGYRYGYGNMVEVRHAGGFATRYAHLNSSKARNGQQVKAGDVVGLMGSTGRSTGPHLHFEILMDDHKVDPTPFIRGGWREGRRLVKSERYKAYFDK